MANELPIPHEAKALPADKRIRAWLGDGQAYVVLKICFWEDRGLDERAMWSIMLADIVHQGDCTLNS